MRSAVLARRIAVTVVAVASVVAACPASAAPPLRLRPFVTGIVAGPQTDGVRLLVWNTQRATSPTTTIYNLKTGRTSTVAVPAGCGLADVAADASVLWSCASAVAGSYNSYAIIHGLLTGADQVLATQRLPSGLLPDAGAYTALGRRWARFTISGYHYSYAVYVSRRTGRQVQPDDRDLRRSVDLDAPTLTKHLCAGLTRPMVPNDDFGIGLKPGALATAGRWGAATSYTDTSQGPDGSVLLERCGHKPQVLQRCHQPLYCSQPAIDHHIVAWTRHDGRHPATSRLYVRSLSSRRTRSLIIPFAAGTPLLVHSRLFISNGPQLNEVLY